MARLRDLELIIQSGYPFVAVETSEEDRLEKALFDIVEIKKELLKKDGVLEYVAPEENLAEVGGFETLKAWLTKRRNAFAPEAREFGIESPRGMLLLGVQGCGKTLVARAVAKEWGLPLLKLEAARLGLRPAPRVAAGPQGPGVRGGDVQQHHGAAAGADPQGPLRRDLLRRPARLDGAARDLRSPPEEAQAQPGAVRPRRPGRRLEGSTGAEIEQAVVSALYTAFSKGMEVTFTIIAAELSATRPLSVTRAEEIAALRAWARDRTVMADESSTAARRR